MIKKVTQAIHNWIYNPKKVILICFFFIFLTLVLDGTLYRWWSLKSDYQSLGERIKQNKQDLEVLQVKIEKAKDPLYIKHQAKDRFDFVEEDEVVFYFTKKE